MNRKPSGEPHGAGEGPGFQVFTPGAIRQAVGYPDVIESVAEVFADYSQGRGESPIMVLAPGGSTGDVHVKSAWMTGRPVFTVKVAAWFAARATDGRSASSGYVAVHDASTGDLMAILQDEHHLTDIRTAAAGAVAARLLAREDATTLAVLGTGVQAYLQVLASREVRRIDAVVIWGRRSASAETLRAAILANAPDLTVSVAEDPRDAVRVADVIITATSSREPILCGSWLRPGQHITAVGADDPTKTELDPACFSRADVLVVDSRREAARFAGDLRAAFSSPPFGPAEIDAEIGDLVLGRLPGRSDPNQITVAKLVGLGVQDLATVEVAMRRLLNQDQSGGYPRPASSQDLAATDASTTLQPSGEAHGDRPCSPT